MEIRYSHPDEGLQKTLLLLRQRGLEEQSRNGRVRRFAEPVMLVNENPSDRVSRWGVRDANPFFHFVESLWMLAGMNEVAPIALYNSGMMNYTDDGRTLRGTAYGYKWRKHFGYDQLEMAIERLRHNPEDRRVVMTMWDPRGEWREPASKDLSCNLQVIFGTREVNGVRVLDMEVTNRSNDIVYGCLGSNVFHFSFLMEYVAFRTGLQMGHYYQVAFNLHGYMDNPVFKRCYEAAPTALVEPTVPNAPLLREMGLTRDLVTLENFVRYGDPGGDDYLKAVGVPLVEAYRVFKLQSKGIAVYKEERVRFAQKIVHQCADKDLAQAGRDWLERRLEAK